jgi:hypothetical protein
MCSSETGVKDSALKKRHSKDPTYLARSSFPFRLETNRIIRPVALSPVTVDERQEAPIPVG